MERAYRWIPICLLMESTGQGSPREFRRRALGQCYFTNGYCVNSSSRDDAHIGECAIPWRRRQVEGLNRNLADQFQPRVAVE
jgi:hypothetical protein